MPIPKSAEVYIRQQSDGNTVVTSVDPEEPASPTSPTSPSIRLQDKSPGSKVDELRSTLSGSSRRTGKSSLFNNVNFKDCRWDFFLCCTPPGRNAIRRLHEALPDRFEGSKVWLDEQHDSSEATLVDGICYSRNVVVFLTAGSTSDAKWQHQMRVAMGARRNFILLGETDEMHGKPSIDELIAKCPADLKPLFNDNVIIPYFEDPDFRNVTFDKMHRVMAVDPDEAYMESKQLAKMRLDLFYKNVVMIDEETEVETVLAVFPPRFVTFSALCGMLLPGTSRKAQLWSRFVQIFIVICMLLCTSRFFTPQGPGFLDYLSVAQIVAIHPVLLLMMFVMRRAVQGKKLRKLLLEEIETQAQAQFLFVKLERLTIAAGILTATLSIWGWIAYLPGFWTSYYLEAPVSDDSMTFALGIVGLLHGVAWMVALPVVFGIVFATLILAFALQEIAYMGLLSAFNELHPEIANLGLEAVTQTAAGMSVKDGDLYRFQARYLRCWEFYRSIQWGASLPFLAFWIAQVGLLGWSIWSLVQGFEPVVDERTLRLRAHWHLSARLTWLIGASPWFGLAGYFIGLLPWGANFYAGNAMSIQCIGAVLAASLMTCDLRVQFRVPLTPSPLASIDDAEDGTSISSDGSNGSDEPGGFSEDVRGYWPSLSHPGSGCKAKELERLLDAPGGTFLRKN